MKRTAKLFASILSALATLNFAVSPAFAATTLTVTADKASGTYDAPISVTLKASDPAAKIWYTFNPKAPPGDALPYSKPLRIDKTTPLLYFAYVDKENESKVERKDYVIAPVTLKIEGGIEIAHDAKYVTVDLQNYGPAAVPLAGWTIRTDMGSRTFSKSAVSIAAGAKSDFTLPYSEWAVTLTSPDGEIRSTVSVIRKAPESVAEPAAETPVSEPSKPAGTARPETRIELAKTEVPPPVETVKTDAATTVTPNEPPKLQDVSPTSSDPIPTSPESVLAQAEKKSEANGNQSSDPLAIKASATESWASWNAKNVAFAALGILAAGVVIRIGTITKKSRG